MRLNYITPFLWLGLGRVLLQSVCVSAIPVPHPVNDRINIVNKDISASIESAKNSHEWKQIISSLRAPWDPTRYLKAIYMLEQQIPVLTRIYEKYLNPPDERHEKAWPKKPLLPSVDEFISDQHAFRHPYSLSVKYSNIMGDETHKFFWYLPRNPDHREPWQEDSVLEPGLSKYREMMRKREELDASADGTGWFWLDTDHITVDILEKYLAPETFEKELKDVIKQGKRVEWEAKLGVESALLDKQRKKWDKIRVIDASDAQYVDYTARKAIHEKRLQEWEKFRV